MIMVHLSAYVIMSLDGCKMVLNVLDVTKKHVLKLEMHLLGMLASVMKNLMVDILKEHFINAYSVVIMK